VGDCYFLTGIAAVAESQTRLEKSFVNPVKNWAGHYALNVYIRGVPYIIWVDDAVPAGSYGMSTVFGEVGWDKSMWGPLLEKAWAKTNGNYEFISGGLPYEGVTFLTNAPYYVFFTEDFTSDSMWNKLKAADEA